MAGALAWIAVALAGVAGAPSSENAKPQITYKVRMVETRGVDWRERVFHRLKPVTRQGAATIWTVPRETMTELLDGFSKRPDTKILQAPTVATWSGSAATVQQRRNQPVVVQAAWNGQETSSRTASENVRVGWHTTMVGRKLDQGILVQVVFEDTVIRAVHHVNVDHAAKHTSLSAAAERVQSSTASDAVSICAALSQAIHGADECCDASTSATQACSPSTNSTAHDDGVAKVVLDVPEIDTQEVLGEWLVGHGEVLLVSFGAHTIADASGMAVVTERLGIIEADEVVGVPGFGPNGENPAPIRVPAPQALDLLVPPPVIASPGQGNISIVPVLPPRAAAMSPLKMPTPAVPSRSLPQGVNTDGTPAKLPPLPDDEIDDGTSSSDSSEPMASPQTKKGAQAKPKPTTDGGTKKWSSVSPMVLPSSCQKCSCLAAEGACNESSRSDRPQ